MSRLTKTSFNSSLQARPLLTRAIEENKYDGLIDPRLQNNYDINEMARMVASAAACIRHSARRRPRMSKVISVYVVLLVGWVLELELIIISSSDREDVGGWCESGRCVSRNQTRAQHNV